MRSDRRPRSLKRRCQETVDRLELPRPFDAVEFIAMLARTRGRPIELIPVTARPHTPCGLLVTTDRADCIIYAADTTALHQQHILLHEAAHIVCGHYETAPAVSDAARVLLPNLPASLVQRVLGRTVYSEPQEREAELVASLLRCRAERDASSPARSPAPPSRLESLFRRPDGPRRG